MILPDQANRTFRVVSTTDWTWTNIPPALSSSSSISHLISFPSLHHNNSQLIIKHSILIHLIILSSIFISISILRPHPVRGNRTASLDDDLASTVATRELDFFCCRAGGCRLLLGGSGTESSVDTISIQEGGGEGGARRGGWKRVGL